MTLSYSNLSFFLINICRPPKTKIIIETSLESQDYDAILLVSTPGQKLKSAVLQNAINTALNYDPTLNSELAILPIDLPASRLVHSPTGSIDADYDDVRVFQNSAIKGVKRALRAGVKRPLLVLDEYPDFENAALVTLLGALEALYTVIYL